MYSRLVKLTIHAADVECKYGLFRHKWRISSVPVITEVNEDAKKGSVDEPSGDVIIREQ
jgi:hypothetical protein